MRWSPNPTDKSSSLTGKEIELAAVAFKVQVQYPDVLDPKDIETAFREARKGRADAVLVLGSPVLESHRTKVADLAAKNRFPAIQSRERVIFSDRLHR